MKSPFFNIALLLSLLLLFEDTPCQFSTVTTTRIQGRKQINSSRILDTIRLEDTTVVFDTTISWTSELPNVIPNYLGKSLMTPTAWGGERGGILFGVIGGTFPQPYSSKTDLIAVAGITVGDANKLGGIVMLNINDVSKIRNFSSNIILNRHISNNSAISIGAIHLLASKSSDAGPSYFIVYSHAVQTLPSKILGVSALHYSLGIGSGRFYYKSKYDVLAGLGRYGTAIFANISYEVYRWMNVNLEWSGLNLHAGISIKPFHFLPHISIGIGDITRFSGDRVRLLGNIGDSYYLPKRSHAK